MIHSHDSIKIKLKHISTVERELDFIKHFLKKSLPDNRFKDKALDKLVEVLVWSRASIDNQESTHE